MKVEIIHQTAAVSPLREELKNAFRGGRYTALRILVAYISWQGISLIHRELEKFHDDGNKISIIVGLGDGFSEPDALRYLMQRLSKGQIFVFHVPVKHFIFHPKIYIFSNRNKSLVLIGSNNFTMGGLFCNSECCVKLLIDHKKDDKSYKAINEIWNIYATPKYPFLRKNLRRISERLLSAYSKGRIIKPRIARRGKTFDKIFPAIDIPLPDTFLFHKKKRVKKVTRDKKPKEDNNVLLLQILRETGADGTQVQIPREVVEEYFNIPTVGHQTIEIKFKGRVIRPAVVSHFPNYTHRISFPEIAKLYRPILMKFERIRNDFYLVELICGVKYKRLIKKCTRQTRHMARKWEMFSK